MVALSEYLRTNYDPDCEWVDGEIKERNVGTNSHGTIQTFFIVFFKMHQREWGVRAVCELRTQVSADRYRIPDVVVMRQDAPFEEIVRTPPVLCIEVLSPEDRMSEMQEKIDDYLAMGVQAVWVVNPRLRRVYIAQAGGGLMPVEDLTVPGTEIRVSSAEVFAELNALEARRTESA